MSWTLVFQIDGAIRFVELKFRFVGSNVLSVILSSELSRGDERSSIRLVEGAM